MLTYQSLQEYYDRHDRILGLAMRTAHQMSHGAVEAVANRILPFIEQRNPENPAQEYSTRVGHLIEAQKAFAQSGKYTASSYQEVVPIDREIYNLSLLFSFFLTNHRFEILQQLEAFLARPVSGPRRILSIGVGTGYELTLVNELQPSCDIDAFEIDAAALDYARELLEFYGCSTRCLKHELYPLETSVPEPAFEARYGKIILCEVLEHLEQPLLAMCNLASALDADGEIFATAAINLAQEDHIYLYSSIEEARNQIEEAGFVIVEELFTPITVIPFAEHDRQQINRGNYICYARNSK